MSKDCTKNENWIKAKIRSRETQSLRKIERRAQRETEYNKNPTLCKNCQEKIPYGKDIKLRKFCSASCSCIFHGFFKIPKTTESRRKTSISLGGQGLLRILNEKCLYCSKLLKNKASKYCNRICCSNHKYETNIKNWKLGKIAGGNAHRVIGFVDRYIKEKYNNKCGKCGWCEIHPISGKSPLQIDHIDGNSDNHKEENLILICPNCHSLTPTYGARNKGSGRTYRRVQYKNQKIKELELDYKLKELQQSIL